MIYLLIFIYKAATLAFNVLDTLLFFQGNQKQLTIYARPSITSLLIVFYDSKRANDCVYMNKTKLTYNCQILANNSIQIFRSTSRVSLLNLILFEFASSRNIKFSANSIYQACLYANFDSEVDQLKDPICGYFHTFDRLFDKGKSDRHIGQYIDSAIYKSKQTANQYNVSVFSSQQYQDALGDMNLAVIIVPTNLSPKPFRILLNILIGEKIDGIQDLIVIRSLADQVSVGDNFYSSDKKLLQDNVTDENQKLNNVNNVFGINAGKSPAYFYVHLQRKLTTYDNYDHNIYQDLPICLNLEEGSQNSPEKNSLQKVLCFRYKYRLILLSMILYVLW